MTNFEKQVDIAVGTNEMELVDFRIHKIEKGKHYEGVYGINVAKVNEIIKLPSLTELPGVPSYIEGIFDLRGVVIPVINLAKWMNVEIPKKKKIKPRVIIAEFNNIMIGFVVHEAKRIRRINWKDIEPAHFNSTVDSRLDKSKITGVTRIENDQVLLILDLESLVQDLGFYQPTLNDEGSYRRFNGSVLILDDSAIARKILREFLAKMGFDIIEANDGNAGIEKLEKLYETYKESLVKHIKFIISDVEMPQMDGFHFSAKIKGDSRFSKIPLMFSSSISDKFSEARGKSAGAESYLVKFDANRLHEEISKIMEKYHRDDIQ